MQRKSLGVLYHYLQNKYGLKFSRESLPQSNISEKQRLWFRQLLAMIQPLKEIRRQRIAFMLNRDNPLFDIITSMVEENIQCIDLLQSHANQWQQLNKYQPTVVVSSPSALLMLAMTDEMKALPMLNKIVALGALLDPLDQQCIEKHLSVPLQQIYMHQNCIIASTCRYGTLHVNETNLELEKEWIDPVNKRFIPIITDFSSENSGKRYKLQNVFKAKTQACACKAPELALEKSEGHCEEIFYFPEKGSGKLKPFFPSFVRQAFMRYAHLIQDYQIIQLTLDRVQIALKGEIDERLFRQVKERLEDLFLMQHVDSPAIDFISFEERKVTDDQVRRMRRQFIM
ncbi:MAG: hypothetical protein BGO43_10075 [Gammaproteobacteria bacterium 39-13]|nr:hypothetical protein [Gammaproteobacteria bacterium]OJV89104.1 MAG: hypothetical protein BGO43_10075 [Gammaproteobacteria bacterium 39-13]